MTALPGIQQDHLDKPALEPVGKCLRTVLLNCIVSNSQQRGNYLVSKRSQIVQKFLIIYALFPDNDDDLYLLHLHVSVHQINFYFGKDKPSKYKL